MALTPLGLITVPTPGTLVPLTTLTLRCQTVFIQAAKNKALVNSGQVYVYLGNTAATAVRIGTLGVPATGSVPAFSATIPNAPGGLSVNQFWLDVDIANDGADCSYLGP